MSWRTLIEFNHDFLSHAIKEDPDGFARAMLLFGNGGGNGDAEALKRFGATVIRTRHHSDPFMSQLPPERTP